MDFSKIRITSKEFIGREEELDKLTTLVNECVSRTGNLLFIEGETGIGKTRLISELVSQLDNTLNIQYLRGRCKYHQGLDPYSPFIEALRNWFGLSETDSDSEEKDKIGQAIRNISPELIGIVPLIRGFLSAGATIYGSYLFKGSNVEKSYQTFNELVCQGKVGLCITREHPDSIKQQHDLSNSELFWLTRNKTEIKTADPSQIEKLRWVVKDFITKNKNAVVIIDGLEYLVLQNNFNSVLKFVELLKDDIALNNAVLLLPINPEALEPREIALLERYMRVIRSEGRVGDISQKLCTSDLALPAHMEKCYPPRVLDMDYLAEKDKMFKAILQLFENITARNSLILFLDDLHWADFSSIQLLQYLFQNMINNNIFIIGSYRPEDLPEGENLIQNLVNTLKLQNLQKRIHNMKLGRLKRNEINKLVKNIFSDQVPEKFINLIFTKSEGNPLYAEEILKSLIEDELISLDDTGWYQNIDYTRIEIPNSINEVVQMRLARVTKGDELYDQILKYTSIIGSTFNFNILQAALDINEEVLLDKIEGLMLANIIYEINVDEFKYDHTLIREVIYNNLSARRKKILHAKIGSCIEKLFKGNLNEHYVKLAYHFSKGGVIDKAVDYSIREGETAKELCAYDEALFHYRSALDMIAANPTILITQQRQIDMYINLGDLSLILGAWNDAKKYFESCLELSGDSGNERKKVEVNSKLGEIEVKRQKWSVAVEKLQEVLNLKLDDKETNIVLVTVDPKYVIRTNISLIRILLKENLKGIFICINHPSYLVDKLLRTHNIPTQNISYLDFITPIADVPRDTAEDIYLINKTVSLCSIVEGMDIDTEDFFKKNNFNIENVEFIMVDNISNLGTYTTKEKIQQFVGNLVQIIKKSTLGYGIFIMDDKTNPEVRELIEPLFEKAVSIKEV